MDAFTAEICMKTPVPDRSRRPQAQSWRWIGGHLPPPPPPPPPPPSPPPP
eukprot:COSAG06_NODE_4139_length_4533_cov_73.718313_6_plen_49_part_01